MTVSISPVNGAKIEKSVVKSSDHVRPAIKRKQNCEREAKQNYNRTSRSDVLVRLVSQMRDDMTKEGLIQDRRFHLKKYSQCFLHRDGFDWLVDKIIKMDDSISKLHLSSGEQTIGTSSVCSSFTTLEAHLEDLKLKATRLGNLFIKEGYILHVGEPKKFSADHKTKVLYFRFCSVKIMHSHSDAKASFAPIPRNKAEEEAEKQNGKQENGIKDFSSSHCSSGVYPPLICVPDGGLHADAISVLSQATQISAPDKSNSSSLCNSDREIDLAILSVIRNMRSDFLSVKNIKDRISHLKIIKRCFMHDDALDWISRQVRVHFYLLQEQNTDKDTVFLLSTKHAEQVAARIGNLLIHHGFIDPVCRNDIFHPYQKNALFFRFQDRVIEDECIRKDFGLATEKTIKAMQMEFFSRLTFLVLTKRQSPII